MFDLGLISGVGLLCEINRENKESNILQQEGYNYLLSNGLIEKNVTYEEFLKDYHIIKNNDEVIEYSCKNIVRSLKKEAIEMEKGKLVVIEGACDGIGKSTQYAMLREHLIKDGEEVISHHFPSYGTFQGKSVEMYLNGDFGSFNDLSPYFINSLYAQDRAITWISELKKYYDEGKFILLDRYTTSSLIYQSATIDDLLEKKNFIDYACDFEYNKLGIKEPSKVIFLHAPFELVTQMRNNRKDNDGVSNDIYERNIEFMKRVYENALFVADYLNWDKVDCSSNGEMKSIDDIHDKVYKLVKKRK